jgi:hypothetical protein
MDRSHGFLTCTKAMVQVTGNPEQARSRQPMLPFNSPLPLYRAHLLLSCPIFCARVQQFFFFFNSRGE